MVEAILWDNDGVLVDSERLFFEANRELLASLGAELTPEGFFEWYLLDNCGGWHLLGEPSEAQIELWRAERNQIYSRKLADAGNLAMPGIASVLNAVAPHYRMGIVTSSYREHFELIHQDLALTQHFEFVLAAEDYSGSKPDPEPYRQGLKRLGLTAERCLVIEDSPRGLAAANAAGIRCIVLRHPLTRHHEFDGAWHVVDSLAELSALLTPASTAGKTACKPEQ